MIQKILIGSGNKGKIDEFRQALAGIPMELIDLSTLDSANEPEETGTTFVENASIKAAAYAKCYGLFTFADDSGLEVTALGGRPGVHSARYGGPNINDRRRVEILLNELSSIGRSDRSARFVCVIALADPSGNVIETFRGSVTGTIALEPSGTKGFGYDPIFVPDGYERSFSDLGNDVKSSISHRARATEAFVRFLLDFTGI